MHDQHKLDALVHDWLHDSLDSIPEPAHRYPVVAAEVNQTNQEQGLLARLRHRGAGSKVAFATATTGGARSSTRAVSILVAGLATVVVGGMLVGQLLDPAAITDRAGADHTPTLPIEHLETGVAWAAPEGRDSWKPSVFDRIAVGPAGSVFVVQEPVAEPYGARLTKLDSSESWLVPEHLGTHNFVDLQVGPDGTIWFNGDEGWATHADGEWRIADNREHIADDHLQALAVQPDGSALAIAQAPFRSGSELSANLVSIGASGEPRHSTTLPSHLTTETRALMDLGAMDVAATATATWVGAHLLEGGGLARLDHGASEWADVEPLGPGITFETNALATGPDGETLWALLLVETEGEDHRSNAASQPWDPVLARFADGTWQSWGLEDGLPTVTGRYAHWYPVPMDIAPDGSVWLADVSNGALRFDGTSFTAYVAPDARQDGYVQVADLAIAPTGEVFALVGDGIGSAALYRIDPRTNASDGASPD